jgi:L-serine dehydratase
MRLADVIGPVMIGPSSSHTAGAARLGGLAKRIWGRPVTEVTLFLRGSFAATFKGHGTDLALLGGLAGMAPDDPRIPDAFSEARKAGISWEFRQEKVEGAHPNSARFLFSDGNGTEMEITGSSIGGGAVVLTEIDGFSLRLSGDLAALVTFHEDKPGVVAAVTGSLSRANRNIASLNLHRQGRGGRAAMVIELDDNSLEGLEEMVLATHPAITRVLAIPGGEDN